MKKSIINTGWLGGTVLLLLWPFCRIALAQYSCFITNPYWKQLLEQAHDPLTLSAVVLHWELALVWFVVFWLIQREQ